MNKEKIKQKQKKYSADDIVVMRLIIAFCAAVVIVASIAYFHTTAARETYLVFTMLPPLLIVFGTICAGCLVWAFLDRAAAKERILGGAFCFALSAAFFLTAACYKYLSTTKLILAVIAALVLYFIYNLFSAQFFGFSLYTAFGCLLFALYSISGFGETAGGVIKYAALAAAALTSAAVVAAAFRASRGKTDRLSRMMKGMSYQFCVIAGEILAGTILGLLFGGIMGYAAVALFATYLVITIIYAFKSI